MKCEGAAAAEGGGREAVRVQARGELREGTEEAREAGEAGEGRIITGK